MLTRYIVITSTGSLMSGYCAYAPVCSAYLW